MGISFSCHIEKILECQPLARPVNFFVLQFILAFFKKYTFSFKIRFSQEKKKSHIVDTANRFVLI